MKQVRLAFAALALTSAAACSVPASDSRYTPASLPDATTFGPVAELLDVRCGSLDCHGTVARNLRLYGSAGLRFSPTDHPLSPTCDTPDEVSQDYESVVSLEPETMSAVASGAADPGSLTMVRKARGTESHKGGAIWAEGDDSDACLTSWLVGPLQPSRCTSALTAVLPHGSSNPLVACAATP